MRKATFILALIAGCELVLAGCGITDPYSRRATSTTQPATTPTKTVRILPEQNPGETPAPPPATSVARYPTQLQSTPQGAIAQFALLYINWDWRTLSSNQRRLATISVGSARLAEQQAAAASGADSEIARARIYNRGQIIAIARSRTDRSQWVRSSLVSRPAATANTTASEPLTTSPSPPSPDLRAATRSRNGYRRTNPSRTAGL